MERVNVTRIEHENLETAVRENRRAIERVERKVDDLTRELTKFMRSRI